MSKLNKTIEKYVNAVKRQPLDYASPRFPMEVLEVLPNEIAKNIFTVTVGKWIDYIQESTEYFSEDSSKDYETGYAYFVLVEIEREESKDLQLMLYFEDLGDCTLPCKYRRALLPLTIYNDKINDSIIDPNGLIVRHDGYKLADRKRFHGFVAQRDEDYPLQSNYYTILAVLPDAINVKYEHETGRVNITQDDFYEWSDNQEPCTDNVIEYIFTYVAMCYNTHKLKLTIQPTVFHEQAWLAAKRAEDILDISLIIKAELIDTFERCDGPQQSLFVEEFIYNEDGEHNFKYINPEAVDKYTWTATAHKLKFSAFSDSEKIHTLYEVITHSFSQNSLWKKSMSKMFTLQALRNGSRYISNPYG